VHPYGIKTPISSKLKRITDAVNHYLQRRFVTPRHNVDIFHETYYSMADYCPVSAKRVITIHDMIPERYPQYVYNAEDIKQTKAYAVRRADHVVCVSENTKRDLIEFLAVPKEKISVVYHGCSLTSDVRARLNSPILCKKPYILFVGFRHGYKNFNKLLRSYASSSLLRSEFALVCFGGGDFSTSELKSIRSLGIPTGKVMHISGDDDVLAGLYVSAALFVCPSLYEGFGIPTLEAMAFGCPVACANTSSLTEVVGDAAELFDPTDEDEMSSVLERVVSFQETTQCLVSRGFERIKQFSWDKCSQDTLAAYKKTYQL
jgi:glycosyltransferase involved in cell wall biosynthesis